MWFDTNLFLKHHQNIKDLDNRTNRIYEVQRQMLLMCFLRLLYNLIHCQYETKQLFNNYSTQSPEYKQNNFTGSSYSTVAYIVSCLELNTCTCCHRNMRHTKIFVTIHKLKPLQQNISV